MYIEFRIKSEVLYHFFGFLQADKYRAAVIVANKGLSKSRKYGTVYAYIISMMNPTNTDNDRCPNCGKYNAMLWTSTDGLSTTQTCRDCGFTVTLQHTAPAPKEAVKVKAWELTQTQNIIVACDVCSTRLTGDRVVFITDEGNKFKCSKCHSSKRAIATDGTEGTEQKTSPTKMNNEYTLTAEQTEAMQTVDAKAATIREATGTNVVKAVREFEAWAKEFPGNDKKDEPSANHAKRILFLSALLGVPTDRISKGKATTIALGQAAAAYLLGQPVEESVDVFAKEKENEQSDAELALGRWETGAVVVSEGLKSLQTDDLNTVTSAVHAAFHTALKGISTKENPFPAGAGEFVSYLLGASGGSTDWFTCSDKFITETKGVSAATLKRQRKVLIDWQDAIGKGIVDIEQESGQPTKYRVNLLGAVSAIVQNLITSENANPENLATLAAFSGKLLTEGTEKLRQQVGEKVFAEAQALGAQIAEAVDNLPTPTFKGSTSAEGRKREHTGSRFKELAKQVKNSVKISETAGLDKAAEAFGRIGLELEEAEKAFSAGGDAPDLDTFQSRINNGLAKVEEATRTKTEIVSERAEAERKATGETSTETAKELASVFASNITANEQAKAEQKASFDSIKTKMFLLAELTRGNADAHAKAYERLRSLLDEAFAQGSHAPTEATEATEEAATA